MLNGDSIICLGSFSFCGISSQVVLITLIMSQEIMVIAGSPDKKTRVINTLANLSTLSGSMIKHCQRKETPILVSVGTPLVHDHVMHFLFKLFSQLLFVNILTKA